VLPASDDNREIFSRAVFAGMKPSAFFINVGRGETVDEAALIDSLRQKRIAGGGPRRLPEVAARARQPVLGIAQRRRFTADRRHFDGYEAHVMPLLVDNMRLFLAGRFAEMQNVVVH